MARPYASYLDSGEEESKGGYQHIICFLVTIYLSHEQPVERRIPNHERDDGGLEIKCMKEN